jgi:uncharacterized protein
MIEAEYENFNRNDNEQQMLDIFHRCQFDAKQGNVNAQNKLGELYRYGKGVIQNYEEAVKCYQMAADQGLIIALYNLGDMYLRGDGVEKDYKEAVKCYLVAADLSHGEGCLNV